MSLEIGIVGAGDIVRKVHLPVLQCLEGVRVAWLHDLDGSRARQVGAAYGVSAVETRSVEELPACDVALLAVPAPVRADYLKEFARRGSAVLCEKPFALTRAEHQRWLDVYPAHRLGCGYMRRFYRATRTIEHVLARRWFGPPRAIRIGEGGRSRGSGGGHSFLEDPRFAAAGGVLLDLGTHTLDLALRFADAVEFHIERSDLMFDGATDRHAAARVRLGTPGVALDYAVSWLENQPNRIEIQFDDVSLWTGIAPDARVFLGRDTRDAVELQMPAGGATTANQAFALEWREFLAGVVAGRESGVSARSALRTTSLAEALRGAAEAGHA